MKATTEILTSSPNTSEATPMDGNSTNGWAEGQQIRGLLFRYVSLVGLGLSILSLIVTVTTYLALRSLRNKTPNRIVICLCFSLLCLYLVFMMGFLTHKNYSGCLLIASLLHYFTLTSVTWINIESYAVYLQVVNLYKSEGVRFFLVSCLIAWDKENGFLDLLDVGSNPTFSQMPGVPLLVVGIAIGIDREQYISEKSRKNICFMATPMTSGTYPWAFYYLNLLLIFLILLINFFYLTNVIWELVFGQNFAPRYGDRDHDKQRKQAIYRTVNDVVILILLVLTWIFGTVVNMYGGQNRTTFAFVFAIIFSLFYFLQGFVVFLLFCVRLEEVRNAWKRWFMNLYRCVRYIHEPLYMVLCICIMWLAFKVLKI